MGRRRSEQREVIKQLVFVCHCLHWRLVAVVLREREREREKRERERERERERGRERERER
jgi:hypothetical protein